MAKLTRSVVIHAPVDMVFNLALDVGELWTSFPGVAARDVVLKPDGVGSSARLFTHFLGFHIEGDIEFIEVIRNERIVAKITFGAESPTWTFTFTPADDGTELTLEGEWHVNLPAVGHPLETLIVKAHENDTERLLAGFKAKVESTAI